MVRCFSTGCPLTVLLCCCCAVLSAFLPCARAEVVDYVPGYGAPLTVHRSGFIEVDAATGTNLFYYYVESQASPQTDPIIWWFNGGPGASSLIGFLSETGPYLLNEELLFTENPYSWNRNANVLYVEFGPGVGYSYCANSTRGGNDCDQSQGDCSPCIADDATIAQQNMVFIEKFLRQHGLEGHPLFLMGESYAGIYIPSLAALLVDGFSDTSVVNLQGIWVSDPCTDNWAQSGWLDTQPQFCYHRGIISSDVYYAITDPMLGCVVGKTNGGDGIRSTTTQFCRRAWRIFDLATQGVAMQPGNGMSVAVPDLPEYLDPMNAFGVSGGVDQAGYMGRGDVRRAFNAAGSPNKVYHLALDGYRGYTRLHDACGDILGIDGGPSMLDVYRQILAAKKAGKASTANLKTVVISNGEDDPVVAMEGTETAVKALGLPELPGGSRRPWFFESNGIPVEVLATAPVQFAQSDRPGGMGVQVGGFVTDFDTGIEGISLKFITIRRSGHMVPGYAPQRAYNILDRAMLKHVHMSSLLPADWVNADDSAFYAYNNPAGGIFSQWTRSTMDLAVKHSARPHLQDAAYVKRLAYSVLHPGTTLASFSGIAASTDFTAGISLACVAGALFGGVAAFALLARTRGARDVERSLL